MNCIAPTCKNQAYAAKTFTFKYVLGLTIPFACMSSLWWSRPRGAAIKEAAGTLGGCPGAETIGVGVALAFPARSTRSLPWRNLSPAMSLLLLNFPAPLVPLGPSPGLKKICSVPTTTATRCYPCRYVCDRFRCLSNLNSKITDIW